MPDSETIQVNKDFVELTIRDPDTFIFPFVDDLFMGENQEHEFWLVNNQIYEFFTKIFYEGTNSAMPIVPANRTTPLLKDLVFVNSVKKEYEVIAGNLGPRDKFLQWINDIALAEYGKDKLNKLNQYLGDEIFHGNGYQIYHEIDGGPGFSVSIIKLIDNHGRKLLIEDVGSGIGYLLPILATLVEGGFVRIQQPELHMHPALQGSIADIFVNAIETDSSHKIGAVISFSNKSAEDEYWSDRTNINRNQLIVETHSEHIILRLLRHIRNREQRKAVEKNPISYKDLSVVYFEPDLKTQSTKVKNLRVAPDGTFVDDWPDGFFMERYRDIFDE